MSDEERKKIFAQNFNKVMKEKNIRQIDIVKDLGLHSSTVSNWSNGIMLPRTDKLELLSKYLHVSAAELMGYEYQGNIYMPDGSVKEFFGPKSADVNTLAAHFDGNEYTEDELEEIKQFAEFVKSRRNNANSPE